ncbi:MAG: nucleotidyltransferase family protein [Thermoanaerobaculia bacterium]|nr:nucleotidyltransferase family protein [Thermoanaerobaculia bacterium]
MTMASSLRRATLPRPKRLANRWRGSLQAMDLGAVLRRIAAHLEEEKQPFALVGALALAALGQPRATLDLDLLISADAQETVVELMESLGYETLHRSTGYSNHLHEDPAWGRVDFVYVRGATREKIFSTARRVAGPDGVPVLVPRPEHLAAMKILAVKNDPGRKHQELADIARLLELPGVDRDEVRGYFEEHDLGDLWHEIA